VVRYSLLRTVQCLIFALITIRHVGCNVTIFSYESEATRVKTIMVESMSTSTSSEFWHRNLVDIPLFTNAFIDKMASENLPVKVTLTRGYKFFHESYIHDVEGKLPDVTGLSVIAR